MSEDEGDSTGAHTPRKRAAKSTKPAKAAAGDERTAGGDASSDHEIDSGATGREVVAESSSDQSWVEHFREGVVVVRRETHSAEQSVTTRYGSGSQVSETTTRRTVREFRDPVPAAGPSSAHPAPVG